MKFQVLGPLTVLGDSGPVVLSGVKQRATLGQLLLHANEVVATSALMRALWDGEPPPTARKMLQNAVSALRGLLATEDTRGGPVLLTHAPGYLLHVDVDDLDLTTYRALADRGRADLAAGAWNSAARTLRAALDLWRGPVLADLAESGTDWPELRTLAQARSATREDLYEAELACGRHQDVLEELETHAQREPARERLCAQLMLALYRRGGQADALDAYRRTRTALASRLGLEPGRVLRAVERAVLDHDPVLGQPDALAIMALDGEPRRGRPAGTPVAPRPATVAPASPAGFDTRPAPGPPPPPVVPAPPPAAAFPYPATPAGVLTAQHKQLSMLLVRTTLGKGLGGDPEDAARLSGELAVAIRDEVARHGGKVSGVLGPVTFALFGVVRTREDDAERAVRAGRAILRRLRQYGAGGPVPVHGGAAPRVAVATGDVVVTCAADGTGAVPIVNGAVPKSCADLLETVPPGGIRVCATTRAGTDRTLAYGPAGPDGACEPLGPRTTCTDTPPALVGREREVEQLRGTLGDVARRQRPCLLTVLGEPGAGKSRLMAELARLARRSPQGYRVVTGHSSWCDRDRPLALLERTLASATATPGTDDRADDTLARTVHALFGTGDRGTWLLDRLRPLLRGEPPAPADWPGLATAWRLLLTGLTAERPLLLVLEDLHTAPDPVLDLVTELADAAGPVPLLVAVTARPELLDRRPVWGGGRRDALALTLDPLDEPSSAALLDALLAAGGELPADVRRDVLARAGGNPLYAVEYARELTSGTGPGRPAGPPPMPRHVRQVVAAHLDTLPPLAKAVLVCASALGGVCCADGVAAVGGLDRAEAAHWLDHLERRDFLRRSRHPSATGALRYAFRHPATREAVDALVPRTVREDRRRRAEAWTENTAAQLTA
ncbi:BTAD domain-containing putative transcriptional regulator [Streptomyces afghaniensis]|uniref:BTAD domain-containing putative transcriptional regulator n=1 Tax=Streptomyces afghaniensis TaxID=66865 RepID=UPI00277E3969|nr:BTAD domain-containing putative transcriptional regulator [Streptomyces afghaniensis]MDQ1014251.1 DNA-binding SARP family transcriptional activator [Streptomyces afghaniensis]